MIKSLAMCAVIAVAMPAFAQDAPPRAVFDATGWTLLGSQTAKGGNDHGQGVGHTEAHIGGARPF